jgi:hypothetical protein
MDREAVHNIVNPENVSFGVDALNDGIDEINVIIRLREMLPNKSFCHRDHPFRIFLRKKLLFQGITAHPEGFLERYTSVRYCGNGRFQKRIESSGTKFNAKHGSFFSEDN